MCSRTYRVQRNGVGFQTVAVIGGSSGHPGSVAPDPERTLRCRSWIAVRKKRLPPKDQRQSLNAAIGRRRFIERPQFAIDRKIKKKAANAEKVPQRHGAILNDAVEPAQLVPRTDPLKDSVMLDGVMLLWFLLTAVSLLFVAIDIRTTPESVVMKWGFVLLTAYTGVVGAFLYVLGCREPLPGLHERYVAARWRQVLGSAMHCVAGDGVGILVGAVLSSLLQLGGVTEMILEYILGFAFGWTIFQALFMRNMAGGSFSRALVSTFVPELVSMNFLMAGMLPTMMALRRCVPSADNPLTPAFWFVMSMALLVGFLVAYPINWWLVANHLKHGMMTVRPASAGAAHDHAVLAAASGMSHEGMSRMSHEGSQTPAAMGTGQAPFPPVPVMTLLSFLVLAAGAAAAFLLRPL
jgi:hypothetical protein